MMRVISALLAAILLGLAVFALGYQHARSRTASHTTVWSTGPTVTQLESLGQLVSTKVSVADVLVAESPAYRGAWLIKGDGLISIDLSRARVIESSPATHSARVRLPLPRVLSARVDHEKTKTWSVEKTTWVPWRGDQDTVRDDAMLQAQKLVEFASNSKENFDHAKSCAETVIQNVYRMVDWQVVVEWDEQQ